MRHNFNVLSNENRQTCFFNHAKHNVGCNKQTCKQWINNEKSNNCVIIATTKGPHTLDEIGKIFDLTRMRICQIEKDIMGKLASSIELE